MDIGLAVKYLQQGKKVARKGWNGKGMWLIADMGTEDVSVTRGSTYGKAGLGVVTIEPHIDMYTAAGTMQPGWLPSQADMFADDWELV